MKLRRLPLTRRQFLGTGASVAAITFVPGHVLGLNGATPANDKLDLACVGVAGRGGDNVNELSGENLVALCDVDWRHAANTFGRFPNARKYRDYRKLLDEVGDKVDGVVVSTPDHTHAVIVAQAIRMGRNVYCEKPMAHSVVEVRALTELARQHQVVTQLGNQGHSFDSCRQLCEWVRDGAIGKVTEVHAMCDSNYSRIRDLGRLSESHTVPETLSWDLWLGPAPARPYNPVYLPGRWRGWSAFGTGVVGDWTCHVVDPVFWALDLGAPQAITAEVADYDPRLQSETFPPGAVIRYEFPAKGNRPPVAVVWYDGNQRPPRPAELPANQKLPGIGAVVIGDKGKILYGSHGAAGLRLLPEALDQGYRRPDPSLPRSPGHHREWALACRSGGVTGSNFGYGGPLTEVAMLGLIALRFKGQKLLWDSGRMQITNHPEANRLVRPGYRQGWKLG